MASLSLHVNGLIVNSMAATALVLPTMARALSNLPGSGAVPSWGALAPPFKADINSNSASESIFNPSILNPTVEQDNLKKTMAVLREYLENDEISDDTFYKTWQNYKEQISKRLEAKDLSANEAKNWARDLHELKFYVTDLLIEKDNVQLSEIKTSCSDWLAELTIRLNKMLLLASPSPTPTPNGMTACCTNATGGFDSTCLVVCAAGQVPECVPYTNCPPVPSPTPVPSLGRKSPMLDSSSSFFKSTLQSESMANRDAPNRDVPSRDVPSRDVPSRSDRFKPSN